MARPLIALIGGGNIGGVLAEQIAYRELGDVEELFKRDFVVVGENNRDAASPEGFEETDTPGRAAARSFSRPRAWR